MIAIYQMYYNQELHKIQFDNITNQWLQILIF